MTRPDYFDRSTWWRLPREARRSTRTLAAWASRTVKDFYAPYTKDLVRTVMYP